MHPIAETILNPIIVKSARARLRRRHILSWGIVVLTVSGFATAITYLVNTEQEFATPEEAARFTILPIIIIQAVVLMLLGTGAVASGVSQERDEGLLDYQRMTPMSPSAKLIGYLFGLPIREYFLFALTLPFLLFGIIRGGFPISTVAHFYLIFFSSVIVYHMTGMTAGMVSSKPRRAGMISQGMVLLLYFALPNLSLLGFTFFEFLTIRPALLGMINEEIERIGGAAQAVAQARLTSLDSFRDLPFFGFFLSPSAYTLLVQGGLIATLWTMVHRKWRDEGAHPFSKVFGAVFFTGASTFLLGSVWPILTNEAVFIGMMRNFMGNRLSDSELLAQPEIPLYTTVLVVSSAAVLGMLCALTLLMTTPTNDKSISGCRRAYRLGLSRVPFSWDAASSLPLCGVCIAVATAAYVVMANLALGNDRFAVAPSFIRLAAPALYVGVILVFLQAAMEKFGRRAFFVSIFLLWVVPFFSSVLLAAAFEHQVASSYVGLPFPPWGLFLMGFQILEVSMNEADLAEGPVELYEHMWGFMIVGIGGYALLAAGMQVSALKNRLRQRETAIEVDQMTHPHAGPEVEPEAAVLPASV